MNVRLRNQENQKKTGLHENGTTFGGHKKYSIFYNIFFLYLRLPLVVKCTILVTLEVTAGRLLRYYKRHKQTVLFYSRTSASKTVFINPITKVILVVTAFC